jgi:hypothetical protein
MIIRKMPRMMRRKSNSKIKNLYKLILKLKITKKVKLRRKMLLMIGKMPMSMNLPLKSFLRVLSKHPLLEARPLEKMKKKIRLIWMLIIWISNLK